MTQKVDVLVAGVGSAGAAVAAACAEAGLRVLAVDRRPLEKAGACWVNGVPVWAFEAAGVALPVAPELRERGASLHMVAGWGPDKLVLDIQVLEVDMRLLTRRLQNTERTRGAELFGEARVGEP